MRDAIFFIQAIGHSTFILLLVFYIRDLKLNIFQIFGLFSPIFLLYPIAELEALGRKEVFIFILFISVLFFSKEKFKSKIVNSIVFIFFPVLCLLWEQVILFAPFFAVILIIKNKLISFLDVFIKLSLIFLPSILVIIFIFLSPLSESGHKEMCNFLINEFNERCYMSAELLVKIQFILILFLFIR